MPHTTSRQGCTYLIKKKTKRQKHISLLDSLTTRVFHHIFQYNNIWLNNMHVHMKTNIRTLPKYLPSYIHKHVLFYFTILHSFTR